MLQCASLLRAADEAVPEAVGVGLAGRLALVVPFGRPTAVERRNGIRGWAGFDLLKLVVMTEVFHRCERTEAHVITTARMRHLFSLAHDARRRALLVFP